ncbi:MAG: hypothetical protein WBB64_02665 [Anaerolineales bacterium]
MISKTVKYNTKSQMELGISLMIADGWKLETTDFIPEKKVRPIEWINPQKHPLITRTNPEYYLVVYSRETETQAGCVGTISAIPRWLLYGVLAATTSLIAIGFLSISDDNCLGMFLGFGFMAPAALVDLLFLQLSSDSTQTGLYYTVMPAAIWFVIGSVIGKIMDLPRFDSVPDKHKNIFSVMILIGIIVIGFFASLIMAGG